MKNQPLLIYVCFYVLSIGFILNSCTRQPIDRSETLPDVKLTDNYLEFKNRKVFDETIESLTLKNQNEQSLWEKQLSFVSMQSLYNKIIEAEMAKHAAFDALPENEKTIKNYPEEYTPLTKTHLNMLSIDQEGLINMNVFNETLAKVVNEDGVVKIGDLIYKYSKDKIRIITNGDKTKLANLHTYTKSDVQNNIYVSDITIKKNQIKNARLGPFSNSCDARQGNCNGCRRVIAYEENIYIREPATTSGGQLTGTGEFITTVVYQVKVRSLRRNWIGSWVDATSVLRAYGTYNIDFIDPANPNPRSYDRSSDGGSSTFFANFIYADNFIGNNSNTYPI